MHRDSISLTSENIEVMELRNLIESVKGNKESVHNICPYCQGEECIKFGKFNGVQRYRCKSCKKTFSDVTNTPFYRSKKTLADWLDYSKLMFRGITIRGCAARLKISISTAFFWRHKILECLFFFEDKQVLEDDIQLSDAHFYENFKGTKGKKMKKRPNPFIRKTFNGPVITVLCAIDSKNNIIVDPMCKNYLNRSGIKLWLENRIELKPKSKFISSINRLNNKWNIKTFNNKLRAGSVAETAKSRMLSKDLDSWIGSKFKGVATKYLNNYLVWFKNLMLGNFTSYMDFFLKKLNILINHESRVFFVNRIEDYKTKEILLYGNYIKNHEAPAN